MIEVEYAAVINRSCEEVFAFVSNPENETQWQSGLIEAKQTSDGPMGVASTGRDVRRIMGKKTVAAWRITKFEPNRQFAFAVISGPCLHVRRVVSQVNGVLVILVGLGVLLLAVLDRGSIHLGIGPRWLVGTALLLCGGIFGLWGDLQLGTNASHGARAPLETSGPYRYSRNPQYVGAIGVLFGFCLVWSSGLALLGAAGCSMWYLLAPFAEESWLRQRLATGYDAYLASTPRFLGTARRAELSGRVDR